MQRLNCEKFPCHFPEQDCSLCFCPFYPCNDPRTGGQETDGSWSCKSCLIVHRSDVAERILDALMKDETTSSVWKRLEGLL